MDKELENKIYEVLQSCIGRVSILSDPLPTFAEEPEGRHFTAESIEGIKHILEGVGKDLGSIASEF